MRLRDWDAVFAECKDEATFQLPCTTFSAPDNDNPIWNLYRSATQDITKELLDPVAKCLATPTKQHLKPGTVPRNSSSS